MKRFKFANKLFTMTLSMVLAFGLCVPGALASTVEKSLVDSTSGTIEKGQLWQKEKGDLSAFEGSDYSHEDQLVDIGTADVSGAGTDATILFVIGYEDGTIERAFADHVTVTGGNKFEKGNVDTFSIPIKKGVLVKEFAVSIWSLPGRLDNPWCTDFISVRGQQRFHFSDANIKKGSTEDKRFWMNNKGDFALFETGVPLASKNSIEVLIHTMNITGAGTDSGFLFRLKYSNGQEKEYLDQDCVRSGVECYEQDDYDFFRIPLIPGERLKSITVEECHHDDKVNAPWCPDWMQIDDGKQLNFCDAEHHKCDQTEDGIWMSNRHGASFTFNF